MSNLTSYHGLMTDGTEVWRDGDKFAARYASGLETISDGVTWWSVDPQNKRVYTQPLVAVELMVSPNLGGIVADALRNPYVIAGPEMVSGRDTTKIEISGPGGTQHALWIDKQTHLPLQWEVPDWSSAAPSGGIAGSDGGMPVAGFSRFEVNPVIDPAVFAYRPPAGYTVIDMGGKAVASAAEAEGIAGFLPLLPADQPDMIVASPGKVALGYRDILVEETSPAAPLQVDALSAWGTAAGGPLRVLPSSLHWVQGGIDILLSTGVEWPTDFLNLACQIAPDLALPAGCSPH